MRKKKCFDSFGTDKTKYNKDVFTFFFVNTAFFQFFFFYDLTLQHIWHTVKRVMKTRGSAIHVLFTDLCRAWIVIGSVQSEAHIAASLFPCTCEVSGVK